MAQSSTRTCPGTAPTSRCGKPASVFGAMFYCDDCLEKGRPKAVVQFVKENGLKLAIVNSQGQLVKFQSTVSVSPAQPKGSNVPREKEETTMHVDPPAPAPLPPRAPKNHHRLPYCPPSAYFSVDRAVCKNLHEIAGRFLNQLSMVIKALSDSSDPHDFIEKERLNGLVTIRDKLVLLLAALYKHRTGKHIHHVIVEGEQLNEIISYLVHGGFVPADISARPSFQKTMNYVQVTVHDYLVKSFGVGIGQRFELEQDHMLMDSKFDSPYLERDVSITVIRRLHGGDEEQPK